MFGGDFMKKNFILIIIFIAITFLLIGAASAASINSVQNQNTIKATIYANSVQSPQAHLNSAMVSGAVDQKLIDSGSNSFYWGERGGIFSYKWKTYKTSTGRVLVYLHYKTTTNSWFSRYSITKFSKYNLKIVETSPEIMYYSGNPSETSFASSTLNPAQYYWNKFRIQIKNGGYFSV
jgi:hypothetical protein